MRYVVKYPPIYLGVSPCGCWYLAFAVHIPAWSSTSPYMLPASTPSLFHVLLRHGINSPIEKHQKSNLSLGIEYSCVPTGILHNHAQSRRPRYFWTVEWDTLTRSFHDLSSGIGSFRLVPSDLGSFARINHRGGKGTPTSISCSFDSTFLCVIGRDAAQRLPFPRAWHGPRSESTFEGLIESTW